QVLKLAYPAIKAADPKAQVMLNALLLWDIFQGQGESTDEEIQSRLEKTVVDRIGVELGEIGEVDVSKLSEEAVREVGVAPEVQNDGVYQRIVWWSPVPRAKQSKRRVVDRGGISYVVRSATPEWRTPGPGGGLAPARGLGCRYDGHRSIYTASVPGWASWSSCARNRSMGFSS
ncbi:MAG: hypothetical protein HY815_05115, partial [Candidatus Riflebacteria bacterium]|nr:hypothetical protein [Candidatus Riflebacteria bacterium]